MKGLAEKRMMHNVLLPTPMTFAAKFYAYIPRQTEAIPFLMATCLQKVQQAQGLRYIRWVAAILTALLLIKKRQLYIGVKWVLTPEKIHGMTRVAMMNLTRQKK